MAVCRHVKESFLGLVQTEAVYLQQSGRELLRHSVDITLRGYDDHYPWKANCSYSAILAIPLSPPWPVCPNGLAGMFASWNWSHVPWDKPQANPYQFPNAEIDANLQLSFLHTSILSEGDRERKSAISWPR